MKILFITHLLPYPPDRGGYIRTYNFIRCLASTHKIDLISYLFKSEDHEQVRFLEPICNEIRVLPLQRKPFFPYLPMSLLSRYPYWYLRDFSARMKKLVYNQISKNKYDIILEEQLAMVNYVPQKTQAYRIYANILIGEMFMDRFRKYQNNPLRRILAKVEAVKLRRLEKKACENVDRVITISRDEKKVLESWGLQSDKITSIPMGVDTSKFKPLELNCNSKSIINLGIASFPPNVEATLHFYDEIFPKIKRGCPEAHLFIVGAGPPKKVRELETDRSVTVTGFVEDLDSFLVETGVFIVPLRIGGGVKVRTLNALAMGLPIVSTSVGVEGIDVTHGKNVLVADSSEDFAKAVIDVLTKPGLKDKLCKNGPILIKEKYTWGTVCNQLNDLFANIRENIN